MATSNGPVRAKRRAAPSRERANRPADNRPRKLVGEVTKDRQATGGARDAAPKKLKQSRENRSEFPLKSVLIGASVVGMVVGVGLLLGRLWMRR
jgi:hypothetical protein